MLLFLKLLFLKPLRLKLIVKANTKLTRDFFHWFVNWCFQARSCGSCWWVKPEAERARRETPSSGLFFSLWVWHLIPSPTSVNWSVNITWEGTSRCVCVCVCVCVYVCVGVCVCVCFQLSKFFSSSSTNLADLLNAKQEFISGLHIKAFVLSHFIQQHHLLQHHFRLAQIIARVFVMMYTHPSVWQSNALHVAILPEGSTVETLMRDQPPWWDTPHPRLRQLLWTVYEYFHIN